MESLSLCYVGGVVTERENKNVAIACHLEFAKLCKQNQCHYHVYATNYSEKRFIDWITCAASNPYFHLHKPVPHEQMLKEIALFDYGVMPAKSFSQLKDDGNYKKEKYIYAGANKHFDYLQAGLPIISPIPEIVMQHIAETCKCALLWTIEEYDFDYLRKNKERLKKNCLKNRHIYEMKNQIPRLLEFYESVRR